MQLKPGEQFAIVRQLDDPFDSGTYYVQAKIRNAETDALIETVNLSDTGNQRFRGLLTVPPDVSGEGFYIDIESMVYTDSGYSNVSEQYRRENVQHLVQDRQTPPFAGGGMGGGTDYGGPDIDYKRFEGIVTKVFQEHHEVHLGLLRENQEKLITSIEAAVASAGGFSEQEKAVPIDIEGPINESKERIILEITKAIEKSKTEIKPIIDRIEVSEKAIIKESQSLWKSTQSAVSLDMSKIANLLKDLTKKFNRPFIYLPSTDVNIAPPKLPEKEVIEPVSGRSRNRRVFTGGHVGLYVAIGAALAMSLLVVTLTLINATLTDRLEEAQALSATQAEQIESFGATQGSLPQFSATTSPYVAVTTRIHGRDLYIPYATATTSKVAASEFCINLTSPDCITAWAVGGGGSSNISTTSDLVAGEVVYATGIDSIESTATTTLTASSPLSLSQPISVIGSSPSALSINTSGTWSGNAGTATALQTARTINGVSFNGTSDITVSAASSTALSDDNTFSGNLSFSGSFDSAVTLNAPNLVIDTATATSTFSGGLGIGAGLAAFDQGAPLQINKDLDALGVSAPHRTDSHQLVVQGGGSVGDSASIGFQMNPSSNNSTAVGAAIVGTDTGGSNAGALSFYTGLGSSGLTRRVYIENDGDVSIGSTTATARLSVRGDGTGSNVVFQTTNAAGTAGITVLENGRVGIGTTSPKQLFHLDDVVMISRSASNDAIFRFSRDGSADDMSFYLNSSNNLQIFDDAVGPRVTFEKDGDVAWHDIPSSGGNAALCYNTSTEYMSYSTSGCTTSDSRLKENISQLPSVSALEGLRTLRGVTFNWANQEWTRDGQMGLVAQEVAQVFPSAVTANSDGFYVVNYPALIAPVIESIKELATTTDSLDARVSALEGGSGGGGSVPAGTYAELDNSGNVLVGSSDSPSGLTLYDPSNNSAYCFSVSSGRTRLNSGECGTFGGSNDYFGGESSTDSFNMTWLAIAAIFILQIITLVKPHFRRET